MQFSLEGKTGILLALVGLAGGGAIMIAPEKLWIGWGLITIAAMGGVALGFHHFGRRFAFMFVAVGVLWFDYWYYSNVLNAPVTVQAPTLATPPIATPVPTPSPTPTKPKLASNISRMILECDSPKPSNPPSLKKRRADFAKNLDLVRKIYGTSIEGNVTEDEITFSIPVDSITGITKQTWLIKRSDDKLYFSITNELGNAGGGLGFIFALASLSPLDPEEANAKQIMEKVEQIAHVESGKCKYL